MQRRRRLRERIETRIARKKGEDVFLPREFRDLAGEDQVLRALRAMVADKQLVRIGYGVYGRARISSLNGQVYLSCPNGLIGAARQVLNKLGVPWDLTEAQKAYNERRSTQVPVNPVIAVKGRLSRRLSAGNWEVVYVR